MEIVLWGCVDTLFLEAALERALTILRAGLDDATYFIALEAVNEQLEREGLDPISAVCFSNIVTSISISADILSACPVEASA